MTVNDSTPDVATAPSPATVITPPPLDLRDVGSTHSGSPADRVIAALRDEVRTLRTRVEALEVNRTSSPITPSPGMPTWRAKDGRLAGWQPARR